MTDSWKTRPVLFGHCVCLFLPLALLVGCNNAAKEKLETQKTQARAQVDRIAQKLDTQTTKTGVYIRNEDVNEKDPWNQAIKVTYSQGGVSEAVEVRSSGPDKEFQTSDDVIAERASMNFKGAGEGIKKNVKDVAAEAAKGVVKGTIDGVKEALPFKKKKKADEPKAEPRDEAANDSQPEKETADK